MILEILLLVIILICILIIIIPIIKPLTKEEYENIVLPDSWGNRTYFSMLQEELGPAGKILKASFSLFFTIIFLIIFLTIGNIFNVQYNEIYQIIFFIAMLLFIYRILKFLFITLICLMVPLRTIRSLIEIIKYNRIKLYSFIKKNKR